MKVTETRTDPLRDLIRRHSRSGSTICRLPCIRFGSTSHASNWLPTVSIRPRCSRRPNHSPGVFAAWSPARTSPAVRAHSRSALRGRDEAQ